MQAERELRRPRRTSSAVPFPVVSQTSSSAGTVHGRSWGVRRRRWAPTRATLDYELRASFYSELLAAALPTASVFACAVVSTLLLHFATAAYRIQIKYNTVIVARLFRLQLRRFPLNVLSKHFSMC